MYSALIWSLTLCETASATGSAVSTGVKFALASEQSWFLVYPSFCNRKQEVNTKKS